MLVSQPLFADQFDSLPELSSENLQAIAVTARILGVLFYYPPDNPAATAVKEIFTDPQWHQQWPYGESEQQNFCTHLFMQHTDEPLTEAYQRLFIGPHALVAPPWGSVYLDKEGVVFGSSTLALRQWMREQHIQPLATESEPEDHIGLLLLLTAFIAEQQPQQLRDFLAHHLLPWSDRYLTLLAEHANAPFYQGIACLTQITLQAWQQTCEIPLITAKLYR